jgi:hypothetical protein
MYIFVKVFFKTNIFIWFLYFQTQQYKSYLWFIFSVFDPSLVQNDFIFKHEGSTFHLSGNRTPRHMFGLASLKLVRAQEAWRFIQRSCHALQSVSHHAYACCSNSYGTRMKWGTTKMQHTLILVYIDKHSKNRKKNSTKLPWIISSKLYAQFSMKAALFYTLFYTTNQNWPEKILSITEPCSVSISTTPSTSKILNNTETQVLNSTEFYSI